jgi:hypothetical protein
MLLFSNALTVYPSFYTTHSHPEYYKTMSASMKLVYNIVTISRGSAYQDVLEKFLTNNQHIAPFVDVCAIGRRIDELYQQHCDAIPNIACHSDLLMYTSLSWISENKHGYNGYFKYIIFTYKTTTGKSIVYKYYLH